MITFDSEINFGHVVTWIVFVIGAIVGWTRVSVKVDETMKRLTKHEDACAEKNREAAALRTQQASIQNSSILQLTAVATTLSALQTRMEKVEARQWDDHNRTQ